MNTLVYSLSECISEHFLKAIIKNNNKRDNKIFLKKSYFFFNKNSIHNLYLKIKRAKKRKVKTLELVYHGGTKHRKLD